MRAITRLMAPLMALTLTAAVSACGSDSEEGASGPTQLAVSHAAGTVPGDIPFYSTVDKLQADGWKVKDLTFDSPDQVLSAVVKGDAQMGYVGTLDALKLIQRGAPIKLLFQNRPEEFVMVGGEGTTSCANLGGKPFGIAAPGAPGTVLAYKWIADKCGAKVKEVVIPDGTNRVAAVQSGQLSGTLLQFSDFLTLKEKAATKANVLMTFKQEFPGLLGLPFVINTNWLKDHPKQAAEFVAAALKTNAEAASNPKVLDAAAKAHLAPEGYAAFNKVFEAYNKELGGFPADGAFTQQSLQTMIDAAFGAGLLKGEKLTVDKVADLSVLENAKKQAA